jgi:hypothetical protein
VASVGDLATVLLVARVLQRRRASRTSPPLGVPHAAVAANVPGTRAAPRGLPSGTAPDPAQAFSHLPIPGGGNLAHGSGQTVTLPTLHLGTESQAQAAANEAAELQANLPQIQAAEKAIEAALKTKNTKAIMAARVPPGSQPASINAFATAISHEFPHGIVDLYPEFHWVPSGPSTWQGFYQLGSSDWVHWSASDGGQSWSYLHQWGNAFDLLKALKAAYALCSQGLSWAEHPFKQLATAAYNEINSGIDAVAKLLPQPWKGAVQSLKTTVDWAAGQVAMAIDDPNEIVQEIPWQDIADGIESATSTIPLLGTAVSDIVASAEFFAQSLSAGSPLAVALDAAYDYLMASVPGLAALDVVLDPIMAFLRAWLSGQSVTKAALTAALSEVPNVPNIAGYTPRSIAASLAAFILSKVHLPA